MSLCKLHWKKRSQRSCKCLMYKVVYNEQQFKRYLWKCSFFVIYNWAKAYIFRNDIDFFSLHNLYLKFQSKFFFLPSYWPEFLHYRYFFLCCYLGISLSISFSFVIFHYWNWEFCFIHLLKLYSHNEFE